MAPKGDEPSDDEAEDTPVIKELKAIDEKYCAIEKEFEQAIEKLKASYFNEKQAPLLAERARVLTDLTFSGAEAEKEYGTPACVSFWLGAFQNADSFSEVIEEWDAPVLSYLRDVKKSNLDDKSPQKGFKLEFFFVENPFIFNSSLWVEYHTNYDPETYRPWKEPECQEMKCSDIGWKPGKNVTVELVTKKVKGGGAKKGKQKAAAAKEESRDSLFRFLFRNLKVGDPPPEDISLGNGMDPSNLDEDDSKACVAMFLNDQFFPMGQMIAEQIIPYAVRFYTGEAGEDDDDDDEDEDSEDEKPAVKKKGQKKATDNTFQPTARKPMVEAMD